jgi:hypothetical protein
MVLGSGLRLRVIRMNKVLTTTDKIGRNIAKKVDGFILFSHYFKIVCSKIFISEYV